MSNPDIPPERSSHQPFGDLLRTSSGRSNQALRHALEHDAGAPTETSRPEMSPPPRSPVHEERPITGLSGAAPETSSARVPARYLPRLKQTRKETGMTNGQIFITAIEATQNDLSDLLFPGGRVGGGLFAARGVQGDTSHDDDKQVTYAMYKEDFDVLDELVSTLKAKSRSHLFKAALTGYYAKTPESGEQLSPGENA